MKKEVFIAFCGIAFLAMLVIAVFTHQDVQDAANDAFHEIKTYDGFKQAAAPVGAQGDILQPLMMQPGMAQQVAMTAPAITADQDKPVLIKYFGCEVASVIGGKAKVTGIMGNSWAEKAGLKTGDILLSFNGKEITSIAQLQDILVKSPGEADYKLDYLRGPLKKHTTIFIGEAEMDGFLPIPQPK